MKARGSRSQAGGTVVRRFTAEDAAGCCAIINAAVSSMDGLNAAARALVVGKNVPPAIARELGGCFTLVATSVSGELLGVAALDGAEIKKVYVRPQAQRRGTGRLLVSGLEDEARRRGLPRLTLLASPSSVPFYRALGFVPLGESTTTSGEARFRHVSMAKDLRC